VYRLSAVARTTLLVPLACRFLEPPQRTGMRAEDEGLASPGSAGRRWGKKDPASVLLSSSVSDTSLDESGASVRTNPYPPPEALLADGGAGDPLYGSQLGIPKDPEASFRQLFAGSHSAAPTSGKSKTKPGKHAGPYSSSSSFALPPVPLLPVDDTSSSWQVAELRRELAAARNAADFSYSCFENRMRLTEERLHSELVYEAALASHRGTPIVMKSFRPTLS